MAGPNPPPHVEGAEEPARPTTPAGAVINAMKLLREMAERGELGRLFP
jgi:hypothetical protein